MEHSIALISGTTSGVGYATACALAAEGWQEIIVTERSLEHAQQTAAQLAAETRIKVFTPLELDLDKPVSVQSTLDELIKRGRSIDFLMLNADMVPDKRVMAAGVEAAQAPLLGYHQLIAGLLRANLLDPNARIVIAGSEATRAHVPTFSFVDVADLVTEHFRNDRSAAVEALLRSTPSVKDEASRAYIESKLIITWWAAALARRLPSGMAVFAAGTATDTKVVRNASPALKYLFIPIVSPIPSMNQTPETAPLWYVQGAEFGTEDSAQFFASAQGTFTGPIEAMRHLQFHDPANQEGAWQAVVNVSGVDLFTEHP
ncbi:MAG: SDR family NAD(P)-dependent oxidoreductase [Candidatus Obscuribacterales bacterium]|nr:SDR family NAD(P)-dependent oxidoreductase [Candidatus Obscuribacterales bacterium]